MIKITRFICWLLFLIPLGVVYFLSIPVAVAGILWFIYQQRSAEILNVDWVWPWYLSSKLLDWFNNAWPLE